MGGETPVKPIGTSASATETVAPHKDARHTYEEERIETSNNNSDALPLDVQVMKQILASMGAEKYEPRVVDQLQEFVHRYVTDILIDAQEYATYAQKLTVDADDIRLAIASRLNHHYAKVPSREQIMELAEKRNHIPLPPVSTEYGVRLPPMQYQIITTESDRQYDHLKRRDEPDNEIVADEPMLLERIEVNDKLLLTLGAIYKTFFYFIPGVLKIDFNDVEYIPMQSTRVMTPPTSPTSAMDSLLHLDWSTLSSDVLLMYAEKITKLSVSRVSTSTEKLQTLLLLSQRLLAWFLTERIDLEHINSSLQKELLEALQASMTQPSSITEPPTPISRADVGTSPRKQIGTSVNKGTNTENISVSELSPIRVSEAIAKLEQHIQNPSRPPTPPASPSTRHQPSKVTGTEVNSTPPIDPPLHSVLTAITIQLQPDLTLAPKTNKISSQSIESPIKIYLQVHTSIIQLQKLMRGYVTRRRFYRMLEDIVKS